VATAPHDVFPWIPIRRVRDILVIALAMGAVALPALGSRMSVDGPGSGGALESAPDAAVGTAGVHARMAAVGFRPGLPTIHELETVTGVNDGHLLVSRRVDLHVPVQRSINDSAFWVGSKDNRLLVVVRPRANQRNGAVQAGQQTTVVGTIQRVPDDEAIAAWGVTPADHAELMERRIYLRAESITALP
jgi:hypothetical protein